MKRSETMQNTLQQNTLQQKEEQLRQAHKMEAIGRLAGGIAHDFNNYLGAIAIINELMMTKIKPEQNGYNDLLQIQDIVKRAAALTRQLLTFSRQHVLELTAIDINAVVGATQKMLAQLLGADIELKVKLAENIRNIRLNQSQVEQVVMNLVVNARDAMPEGGVLYVTTSLKMVEDPFEAVHAQVTPGDYVLLTVKDSGCGMSPEILKCIFEPFFTTKGQKVRPTRYS